MNSYSIENFEVMTKLEETIYKPPKTRNRMKYMKRKKDITLGLILSNRLKISIWFYKLADALKITRETATISISYFDRYIARYEKVTSRKLHLASLAAFHLAVKVHESKLITFQFMAKLSEHTIVAEEIKLEQDAMMMDLSWRLNPPTPEAFLYLLFTFFSKSLPFELKCSLYTTAKHFTELSVCHESYLYCKPSTVALASIIVALDQISFSAIESRDRAFFFASIFWKTSLWNNSNDLSEVKNFLRKQLDENKQPTIESRQSHHITDELNVKRCRNE